RKGRSERMLGDFSVPKLKYKKQYGICNMNSQNRPQCKIDIGMPSRAFPVTPPGVRVRTTAVRLVKLFNYFANRARPRESK
ncbi:MAG: hypothetical protein ACYSUC_12415, partial [Planctomycetota bacterium]